MQKRKIKPKSGKSWIRYHNQNKPQNVLNHIFFDVSINNAKLCVSSAFNEIFGVADNRSPSLDGLVVTRNWMQATQNRGGIKTFRRGRC